MIITPWVRWTAGTYSHHPWKERKNDLNQTSRELSGQISIFPKPELRGFGEISLTKPPFGVTSDEVVIICPELCSMLIFRGVGSHDVGHCRQGPFFASAHSRKTRLDSCSWHCSHAMAWCLDHKRYPQNIPKKIYIYLPWPKISLNPKKCQKASLEKFQHLAPKSALRSAVFLFSLRVFHGQNLVSAPHRRLDTKSISACTKSSAREILWVGQKENHSKPPWLWLRESSVPTFFLGEMAQTSPKTPFSRFGAHSPMLS